MPAQEFVYALGRVEPRFPSLAVEKEFAQVAGQFDTSGQTDREVMHAVLSDRANRYMVRQLCWTLTIGGLECYLLLPRDPNDREFLVESVRAKPRPTDLNVVVGLRGPIASPETCGGLMLPLVAFDQIYSFDRNDLIAALPHQKERPSTDEEEAFRATANELLDRIMQVTDNAGASDEHRAINYLAVRYPAIYTKVAEAHGKGSSLTSLTALPSRLSGARNIVNVILGFTDRQTDVSEKYFVRVDVMVNPFGFGCAEVRDRCLADIRR
jgi:hypothetical protein